jgi:hypothetical protein
VPAEYARGLRGLLGNEESELCGLVDDVVRSLASNETAADYTTRHGGKNGVSGYILHTVPAALHVWLTYPDDYRHAVVTTIRLGGDSDTAAAIVGALVGARVGRDGIPPEWLRDLWEWPRTATWIERLAARLAHYAGARTNGSALPLNAIGLALRNVLFIPLVLAHGFRRLFPPY